MLLDWQQRPTEVANLLNPAFCSVVLRESLFGFRDESDQNMPYVLVFLVLPLVLHRPTRELLPRKISSKFHAWVHGNQHLLSGYQKRIISLVPFTKEAIYWSIKSKFFNIDEKGNLVVPKKGNKSMNVNSISEFDECMKKSYFVGRWLTRSGESSTIYAILGIRP